MNRETFLWRLMEGLKALDEDERAQVTEYYQELLMDGVENGKTEEEVVAGFGDPAEVARQILTERGTLMEKEAQFEQEREEHERRRQEYEQQRREHEQRRQEYEQRRQEHEQRRREYEQRASGQPREYCARGPVETVLVQVRDRRVEVRESEDGVVRVWFAPQEGERVEVREANGAFQFVQKASFFNVHGLFFCLNGGQQATVEVPRGFTGTVCVQTTNGRMEAKGLTVPGRLQLVSTNSRIAVSDCALGRLSGKTTNGRVVLEDLTGDACEAATSNGRAEAKNCILTEHLWLESSNGAIHIERVDAQDISLHTSNGSIKGTVAGARENYSAVGKTTNGHCNLHGSGQTGEKKLRAITTNGGIHIEFEGGGN